MAYPHEFPTTIPARLGLPGLVGKRYEGYKNLAEGIVIKPVKNAYFHTGSRVMLKKKIDMFAEIIDVRKPDPNKKDRNAKLGTESRLEKELTAIATTDPDKADRIRWLCGEIERYVNQNRLEAVISKIGEESVRTTMARNRGRLIGLLAQDALEDLLKQAEAKSHFDSLSKEHQHIVTKRLNTLASVPVAKYFNPPKSEEISPIPDAKAENSPSC